MLVYVSRRVYLWFLQYAKSIKVRKLFCNSVYSMY